MHVWLVTAPVVSQPIGSAPSRTELSNIHISCGFALHCKASCSAVTFTSYPSLEKLIGGINALGPRAKGLAKWTGMDLCECIS